MSGVFLFVAQMLCDLESLTGPAINVCEESPKCIPEKYSLCDWRRERLPRSTEMGKSFTPNYVNLL